MVAAAGATQPEAAAAAAAAEISAAAAAVPTWLQPLMATSFFALCETHRDDTSNGKIECNMYCIDCMGNALCSLCLADHDENHCTLQIRRSSYCDVIRAAELSKLIDISSVQTYTANRARIVFINRRPMQSTQQQAGQGKGGVIAVGSCEVCSRGLPNTCRFCSLQCKLEAMQYDPSLTFALGDSDSNVPLAEWPKRKAGLVPGNCSTSKTPAPSSGNGKHRTKDTVDHAVPVPVPAPVRRKSRRKGVPHRAPFF